MISTYRMSDYAFGGRDFVFGWLRFERQGDRMMTCLLQERGGILRLIIPFHHGESEVLRWFLPNPSDDKEGCGLIPVPERVWVEEVETGSIFTLVGPRTCERVVRGEGDEAFGVLASGLIVVSYSPGDFGNVLMMRSGSSELFRWIGHPVATLGMIVGNGGVEESSHITTDPKIVGIEGLPCSASLSVTTLLEAGFPCKGEPLSVTPCAFFETDFDAPVGVNEALGYHAHFKSLLDIVYWDDIGFDSMQLLPSDLDLPDEFGGQSCVGSVLLRQRPESKGPLGYPPAFFGFDDIGPDGLARWFSMQNGFGRAIDRLDFAAKSHEYLNFENLVITFCTAVDEVASVKRRLDGLKAPWGTPESLRIVMDYICEVYPVFEVDFVNDVVNDVKDTYNAIKHTEEERGGRLRNYWTSFENLCDVAVALRLLLQAWLAAELGCTERRVVEHFFYESSDDLKGRWRFFDVQPGGLELEQGDAAW